MTRTELMYDAVPEGVPWIPSNAPIVAGYIDGLYQSFPLLVRRFGGKAKVVSIGVNIGNLAEWSDVEPGNAIITPAQVRADWEHKRAHGIRRPGFYADLTRMRDVVLPGLAGIPRTEYKLWLADWDGNENFIPLPGGVEAAKQFRNYPHYDVSAVNPDAFFDHSKPNPVHHNIGHPHKTHKPKRTLRHPFRGHKHHPRKVHPKAAGGAAGGGLGTALVVILVGAGVHITPAEGSGIATLVGFLLSYLAPQE